MKQLMKSTLSALIAIGTVAVNAGERVGDFALIDHQGTFHHMAWYDDHKAVVIVSHANGAADSSAVLTELNALQAKYESQGVKFFLLNPGLQTDRAAVQADAAAMGIELPILMDDAQLVAEQLGFTQLGQAVVYTPNNFEVQYRGPVQAQMDSALQNVIAGSAGDLVDVASAGTSINYGFSTAALSYEKDIALVIAENCAACHRDGGIAPFALNSYLTVQGWSPMIREVLMTKRMPPGQVDDKVGHKIRDARNLTDAELQKLVRWIDAGSVNDSSNDPLAALVWPESKWAQGEPDLIVKIPPQTVPATGVVDYMDIAIDLGLNNDRWVRGSQIIAGEPSVLHHVITTVVPPEGKPSQQQIFMGILNSLPPEQARPIQQQLMAAASSGQAINFNALLNSLPADADISLLLGGSPDPDSAPLTNYAPGTLGSWNAPGVGGLLRAGSSLDLQVHYTTTGKEVTDASEMGIYFYPEGEVPTERITNSIANNFNIAIPAGARDHEMQATVMVTKDAYLQSFGPHMHFRGKRMKFIAQYPDGREELLLSVPNYSFNWQSGHVLEEPLLVPAGTRIVAVGAYDNSAQNPYNPDSNTEVVWGEQSAQEMFMAFYAWQNTDQGGSD